MYQTSQIGTFHSTVNNFALKMVVFSHYNMYDRYVGVNNFICSITCGCSSWWLGGRKFVVYIFQDWRLLLSIWRGHIESASCYKGSDHALQKKLMEKTACNLTYGDVSLLMSDTFTLAEASSLTSGPLQPSVSCLPEIQPPLCNIFVHS